MMRRRRLLWLALIVALLTGYGLAYCLLPTRITRWGITHLRIFERDFQPYFFAPAGWFEALVIRLYPPRQWKNCAHVVVLKTTYTGNAEVRVELRFPARPEPPPAYRTIGMDEDILARAAQEPGHTTRLTKPPQVSRYSRFEIDEAEDYLRDRFPRPYTLAHVLAWYAAASDEQTQLHLLTLLAASRDPRAGIAITGAFYSGRHLILGHAREMFHWYFLPPECHDCHNTETMYAETQEWLERNSGRLWADSYEAIYGR
jgi:hypothetical protein